ncbi:MAG TPA: hypothetical protein VK747_04360 [Blastocatellia bacterium]|nr:hypothetical protein [Blastocatellia bacterium]
MRGMTAADLLSAWEQGVGQPSFRRALILLSAACPEVPAEQLARLSIGERDAYLLALRESILGPDLVSVASCSACGEQLEFACKTNDIRRTSRADPASLEPAAAGHDESARDVRRMFRPRRSRHWLLKWNTPIRRLTWS